MSPRSGYASIAGASASITLEDGATIPTTAALMRALDALPAAAHALRRRLATRSPLSADERVLVANGIARIRAACDQTAIAIDARVTP